MPSTLPSSFASAAAGNHDLSSRRSSSRTDGFGEWSRRPNGATQTFRRPSGANVSSSHTHQRDISSSLGTSNSGTYVPPHLSAIRNGLTFDARYSREQLLDLFKEQRDAEELEDGVLDLYLGDEDLGSGVTGLNRWNRRDEVAQEAGSGPEICLNRLTGAEPLGLHEMTQEEKECFSTSVNSPLKGPNAPGTREGQHRDPANNRKTSLSQTISAPGLTSPTASRPPNRRREPSESFPFPREVSGLGGSAKIGHDDIGPATPPASLVRRRMDLKDGGELNSRDDDGTKGSGEKPSGAMRRVSTGPLSAGANGPQSPWYNLASGPFAGLGQPNGPLPSSTNQMNQRRPAAPQRGESRFRSLMGKETPEEPAVNEQHSFGDLGQLREEHSSRDSTVDDERQRSLSGETDPFSQSDMPIGSAALGGAHEDIPPITSGPNAAGSTQPSQYPGFSGFSGLSTVQNTVPFYSRHEQFPGDAFQPQYEGEPLSPTITNPYQSPERRTSRLNEVDSDDVDLNQLHLPGLGAFGNEVGSDNQLSPFNPHSSAGPEPNLVEGTRHSTFGSSRVLPSLGGLGPFGSPGQWPAGFSPMDFKRDGVSDNIGSLPKTYDELQYPGLAGPSGSGAFAPFRGNTVQGDTSGALRGSKLGSLLPSAMQDQMPKDYEKLGRDIGEPLEGAREERERNETSTSNFVNQGWPGYASMDRELESQFNGNLGKYDDMRQGMEHSQEPSPGQNYTRMQPIGSQPTLSSQQQRNQPQQAQQQQPHSQSQQLLPASLPSASNQLPAAQQKQMVMPDRIRWIYRDPQGNTQGPWSGLEMHDWYRAGFFSPELLVKKAEDTDYEPLAQLIRRIGNSREPFLVPQIGIPAPVGSQTGGTWPTQTNQQSAPANAPSAQPPFANSFPSFGTTLTAEQQNALERRKQEEQFLMARQKEHLAQQQVMAKQMQVSGGQGLHPQPLQHHSSAQSLQSQPSYGSITSPGGFPGPNISGSAQTPQAISSSYENSFRHGTTGLGTIGSGIDVLGHLREQEAPSAQMERINLVRAPPSSFGSIGRAPQQQHQQDLESHEQRTAAALADRGTLQCEQAEAESHNDEPRTVRHPGENRRLQEFNTLQNRVDDPGQNLDDLMGRYAEDSHMASQKAGFDHRGNEDFRPSPAHQDTPVEPMGGWNEAPKQKQSLSLTEQVQQAASTKQSPSAAGRSTWEKTDNSVADPQTVQKPDSPLPAPAARRSGTQNVADALTAESVSQSTSPIAETPSVSIAPWAKEHPDVPKQPSLKEIQESEARRAAKQEEAAAAARRVALEKDLTSHPAAPAPSLPSTSIWGSNESGASPTSNTSAAWVKGLATKATSSPANSKRTLQQIQKEEEEALARKQKVLAIATNTAHSGPPTTSSQAISAGKRYADLAGKAAAPPSASGGAWTTVGAGGKPKIPAVPTGPASHSKSATGIATAGVVTPAAKTRPVNVPARAASINTTMSAQDEFKKWAVSELRPDLNRGIQVDDFVNTLYSLPADTEIITEAVYSNSSTIDSRHFAEEFVRRRALADKGKSQPNSATTPSGPPSESKGGGWSEVARKGPTTTTRDESNAFKIVAAKKKSGKK